MRSCHRGAPFLFFNGNTFADVGRNVADFIFADAPTARRRTLASVTAHYIAGVLGREEMAAIVESLWRSASLEPGMKVRTLRGSLRGTIVRLLEDGRVVWRPDGGGELIALPETLATEEYDA